MPPTKKPYEGGMGSRAHGRMIRALENAKIRNDKIYRRSSREFAAARAKAQAAMKAALGAQGTPAQRIEIFKKSLGKVREFRNFVGRVNRRTKPDKSIPEIEKNDTISAQDMLDEWIGAMEGEISRLEKIIERRNLR